MKKINILIISSISAVILFILLTIVQGKIIKKEATVIAYISNIDLLRDSKLDKSHYKEVKIPLSLALDSNIITDVKELEGKYVKEPINKGQIIFKQDVAKKDELKIIEADNKLERIAIKVKESQNAVAYQIKPKDRIHLYFTGKSSVIKNTFLKYGIDFDINVSDNLLQSKKIIEDIEILGIYDEAGRSYENSEYSRLDTIVIAVEAKTAEMINNLRTQGTFDITR